MDLAVIILCLLKWSLTPIKPDPNNSRDMFKFYTSSGVQLGRPVLLEDIHLFFPYTNGMTTLQELYPQLVASSMSNGLIYHSRNTVAIFSFPAAEIKWLLHPQHQKNSRDLKNDSNRRKTTSSVVQISHIWNSSSESVASIPESAASNQRNFDKMIKSNPASFKKPSNFHTLDF